MPIRSNFKNKKKYKYRFKCFYKAHPKDYEHLVGDTDDPRRTLTSIWKVYTFCIKEVCIDLGDRKKRKELCITEHDNREVTYVYNNEKITKEQFKQILNEYQKYDNGSRKRLRKR